jgi:hypothetical protein
MSGDSVALGAFVRAKSPLTLVSMLQGSSLTLVSVTIAGLLAFSWHSRFLLSQTARVSAYDWTVKSGTHEGPGPNNRDVALCDGIRNSGNLH